MARWHDPALWHRAKQEISPPPRRSMATWWRGCWRRELGRSAKCLVLDLDNTLWGGVVGDDGWRGSCWARAARWARPLSPFQAYARELARRGVILAVCSKNDEANALAPFERHPEMVLRRADIACFVANWQDKAANLRAIAAGAEHRPRHPGVRRRQPGRAGLVRQELPMVAVPELPDDPT